MGIVDVVLTTPRPLHVDRECLAQAVLDVIQGDDFSYGPVTVDRHRGHVPTKDWWATLEAILWTRLEEHWGRVLVSRPLGPVSQIWTDSNGETHVTYEPWEQKSITVEARGQRVAIDVDLANHSVTVTA